MTTLRCSRIWQVEASRDGRLSGPDLDAVRAHVPRCVDCTREEQSFAALSESLRREETKLDAVSLRRLRNATLARVSRMHRDRTSMKPGVVAAALVFSGLAVCAIGARSMLHRASGTSGTSTPENPGPSVLVRPASERPAWTRSGDHGTERIDLVDGALSLATRRTSSKTRLIVHVPDGEIEDVGTAFTVDVTDGRTRSIAVTEGAVIFRRPDLPDLRIPAGTSWVAPPREPVEQRVTSTPRTVTDAAGVAVPSTKRHPAKHRVVASEPSPKVTVPDALDEDATYLHIVALLREGRAEEARMSAVDYLRKYPDGFRRAEVERVSKGQ